MVAQHPAIQKMDLERFPQNFRSKPHPSNTKGKKALNTILEKGT